MIGLNTIQEARGAYREPRLFDDPCAFTHAI